MINNEKVRKIGKNINDNYEYGFYQEKLDDLVKSISNIRERVVAVALFLATDFPKLPYFWGGGHDILISSELKGLDPNWGKDTEIIFSGSKNYKVGESYPKSLDCSGFISWCLVNGGFNIETYLNYDSNSGCLDSSDCTNLGINYLLTCKDILDNVKTGDLAWMEGHVGIVVNLSLEKKYVVVAHISDSGDGMNLTTLSLESGLVLADDLGEDVINNNTNRIGKQYFTHIISMDY